MTEFKKEVPLKIYQFLVVPKGVSLGMELSVLTVRSFTSDEASAAAAARFPGKGLILVGSVEAETFLDDMGFGDKIKEAPEAKEEAKATEKSPDYSTKTEEEIERLCLYLKSKGYSVRKPKAAPSAA